MAIHVCAPFNGMLYLERYLLDCAMIISGLKSQNLSPWTFIPTDPYKGNTGATDKRH